MSRLPFFMAAMAAISLMAVGTVILAMYDPHTVMRAVVGADISLLLWALVMGVVIQVLRAQRVKTIVCSRYRISLEQSFGARVLSHSVTGIVPLGPGGIALEGLLLRRFAQVPIAFSTGVFTVCGVLDRGSIIPILALALLVMHLPEWIRLFLLGTLMQSTLSLLIPLLAAVTRSRLSRFAPRSGWRTRIIRTIVQVDDGLAAVVAGSWRTGLPALALSFLIAAASLLRLALLLAAFGLRPAPGQVILLLLMVGLMGSMPVQIPGASAWATGKFLRFIHVLGPGAGAFVLLSSVVGMVEAPLLSLGMLVWWTLARSRVSFRLTELVVLSQESRGEQPSGADAV